jgi:hypothetical protein
MNERNILDQITEDIYEGIRNHMSAIGRLRAINSKTYKTIDPEELDVFIYKTAQEMLEKYENMTFNEIAKEILTEEFLNYGNIDFFMGEQ